MRRFFRKLAFNLRGASPVSKLFLVQHGTPNEGYIVEGIHTTPEDAGDHVLALASTRMRSARWLLKSGEIKVEVHALRYGRFTMTGELTASDLGLCRHGDREALARENSLGAGE